MTKGFVGFQVTEPKQPDKSQQQQQRRRGSTEPEFNPTSIGEFIVNDVKLFVSPMKAIAGEFMRQIKRGS